MPVRVGINGFGRIGRNVFRAAKARAASARRGRSSGWRSTTSPTPARSRTCSSTTRSWALSGRGARSAATSALEVDGRELKVLAERDPAALPWGELGVDVVIESTGPFHRPRERRQASRAGREEGGDLRAGERTRT